MKIERSYSDAALLAAIRNKDTLNDAIHYLYRQFSESVSSFIIHNSGNQADADDIFQETVVSFIELVQKDKFREESGIKTILVAIARNLWLNELKKRDRSGHRDKVFENSRDNTESDVSHLIGDREVKQQFRELLSRLGEPCKKILLLFYYENMAIKEMVEHLPYENEQVVRNKKHKCLQQLAGLFKDNPKLAKQMITRNNP